MTRVRHLLLLLAFTAAPADEAKLLVSSGGVEITVEDIRASLETLDARQLAAVREDKVLLEQVVRAANATITAGGTTFAVRAFDDEQAVIIAVDEGTVSVSVKDQSGHTDVAAGSAVRVARDGSTQTVDVVERTRMLGWLRDSLSFTNEPVRTVLQELNRWFDLKASLGDAALGDRPVTMRVSLESSGNALKALASAAKLSVGFDAKQQVVLRDAPVPTTSSAASSAKRPAKAKAAASTSKRRP